MPESLAQYRVRHAVDALRNLVHELGVDLLPAQRRAFLAIAESIEEAVRESEKP
jgi:hypothetical protein